MAKTSTAPEPELETDTPDDALGRSIKAMRAIARAVEGLDHAEADVLPFFAGICESADALEAAEKIARALAPLSAGARKRVLDHVAATLGVEK